jgi:uncharacterized membrane protein
MVNGHSLALCLALGFTASVMLALGLLMMKHRAAALPMARGWEMPRAIGAWIRDPVWIGGLGVQAAGYVLYVFALTDAPVSMMAVAMQGGIALFVVLAVTFLGERARIWEWLGIGAILLAAVLLAVSLGGGAARGALEAEMLAATSIVAAAIIAVLLLSSGQFRQNSAAAAIASGIAFGMGSLYTKALADAAGSAPDISALAAAVLTSPFTYLVVVANVAGLILLQNAFAIGRGIVAMPLSSALSNLVPIAGGIVAFGERLPADSLDAAMRVGAFLLTIAASAALAAGDVGAHVPQEIVPAARSDSISPSA